MVPERLPGSSSTPALPAGPVVGRYAPSPTGEPHLGNLRTALLAWLHTRSLGGRHLLRLEDLDAGRVRPGSADTVRADLRWLGLDWDAEYIQSSETGRYAAALRQLPTYPCTCTRREITAAVQASASAPHSPEPVYPGTCRDPARRQPARPAASRWAVPGETVCIQDQLSRATLCQQLPAEVGDLVLRRSDGVYAYHLAVVVDDAAQGVTDVVRGADLLAATPRQVALQRALGLPTPRYWHVPLLHDHRGERLAKRGGAPSVRALRQGGSDPARLRADLAHSLGWPVGETVSLDELLPLYRNWARLSQTPQAPSQDADSEI